MKNKLGTEEILETLTNTLAELKEGIKSTKLDNEALSRVEKELDKVELQGYKTKLGFEILILSKSESKLSSRDFLLKILSFLPQEIPSQYLPPLTSYVLDEWNKLSLKMAA